MENSTFKSVPIDQLRISIYSSWHDEDCGHPAGASVDDDLAASIRHVGLLEPLTVIGPMEDGGYDILSGARRYRAILSIRKADPGFMPEVPCWVVGDGTMSEEYRKILIETTNLERNVSENYDGHRFQLLKLLRKLSDGDDKSIAAMADSWADALHRSYQYSGMCRALFPDGPKK